MLTLKPIAKYLVYKEEAIDKTPGGLVVPENVHRWQRRQVLDTGPEVTKVKPGDMFIINPQFESLPVGNEQTGLAVYITHEDAVLAIVEESFIQVPG